MISVKQKGVMTYHNAKKHILSAKMDVETQFLFYLYTGCVRILFS